MFFDEKRGSCYSSKQALKKYNNAARVIQKKYKDILDKRSRNKAVRLIQKRYAEYKQAIENKRRKIPQQNYSRTVQGHEREAGTEQGFRLIQDIPNINRP